MAHHRPYAGNVLRGEQHLLVMSGEQLVSEINNACADEYPHEGEMPLQRSAQPSPDCQPLWHIHQVLLAHFWPKAWKSAEDPQPTSDQYKKTDCVDPMCSAHDIRMLVSGRHSR